MPPRTPRGRTQNHRPPPPTILAPTPAPSVGSLVPRALVSLLCYCGWDFSRFITMPEDTLHSRLSAGGTVTGVNLNM